MRYKKILEALEDEQLYSPSGIAAFAERCQLLPSQLSGELEIQKVETAEATIKLEKQRVRIWMGRFSNSCRFPDHGDGFVTIRGQAPCPGWYGWRWKEAYYRKQIKEECRF